MTEHVAIGVGGEPGTIAGVVVAEFARARRCRGGRLTSVVSHECAPFSWAGGLK
jgi:hypothetical protein